MALILSKSQLGKRQGKPPYVFPVIYNLKNDINVKCLKQLFISKGKQEDVNIYIVSKVQIYSILSILFYSTLLY